MSRAEARRHALVQFGGLTQTREAHHDVYAARPVEELVADTRYTLRTMRRTPALAAAAILTLALGVGANTAIFSAVNAVILRPLPFPNPEQLYMLWEENPEKGWYKEVAAPANMFDWKEQVASFADVMGYADAFGASTLSDGGEPTIVKPAFGTGNFFSVLGARAALGRTFTGRRDVAHRPERRRAVPSALARPVRQRPARDRPNDPARWEPRAGGRRHARLASRTRTTEVDLWQPWRWNPNNRQQVFFRRAHWVSVVARLKPGVTQETADAQLQAVVKRLQRDYPQTNKAMGAGMTPLHEFLIGDTRLPLLVLLGAVGLLLLIACANVGNLMLVKAAGREREAALRLALGAGRRRLVRQALTESLVTSVVGGAAGVALGWWGTRALQAMQPAGMLRVSRFEFDWVVLAYVLAITTVSGLLFGIAPALWSSRRLPLDALKEGGRGGSESRRIRRWGERLVIGEVALALMLSVGAGLLVRSLLRLEHVDPGFDPNGVLAAKLVLPGRAVRHRREGPLVLHAAGGAAARHSGRTGGRRRLAALARQLGLLRATSPSQGWPAGTYGSEVAASPRDAGLSSRSMKTPVLAGRAFTADDRANGPQVVVINEAFAKKHFKGQDPIGKRITFDKDPDSTSTWNTIVGVVKSQHQTKLSLEPQIEVFEPLAQSPTNGMFMVLRTAGDPASLGPAIRRTVAELDRSLALESIRDHERSARAVARARALPHDAAAAIRERRTGAGRRRRLRRDGADGASPSAGDGDPARARCAGERRAVARRSEWPAAGSRSGS